jgi:hypothetical protein
LFEFISKGENMSTELNQEIELIAQGYMNKSSDELFRLFLKEWGKVKPVGKTPVRGEAGDFWIGVKNRLVAKAVKNPTIVTATVSTVVSEVLKWALTVGVDILLYKIAISIFVTWVTLSVLEELKARKSSKGK